MAKYLRFLCIALAFNVLNSTALLANESLLADDLFADDMDQSFDEWSDDDDTFALEEQDSGALFPWLTIQQSQKWGVNPANDWNTTRQRSELTLGASGSLGQSSYGEIELKGKYYWHEDSKHSTKVSDFEIERGFLQYSSGVWSTKLGKYTIGWGELEGGALDVINPSGGLTDPSQTSQWLISATRYWPDRELSVFYNPNPEITKVTGISLIDGSHREIGIRYGINQEGGDIAVYAAHLIPNGAVKDIANSVSYAKGYQLLGFSMNKVLGNHLLKFDVAYKHNLEHNNSSQLLKVDRLDWNLALDIGGGDRQWLLAISSQYWLDFADDYLTPGLLANVSTSRSNFNYIASVSDEFENTDWSWDVLNIIVADGDLSLLTIGLNWDINDQWQASAKAIHADAKLNRAFALLDGYQRVQMEVKYQF